VLERPVTESERDHWEALHVDSGNDATDRAVRWRVGIPDVFLPRAMGQTYGSNELRWSLDPEPSPKRLHPLLRFGNRIGGLAILAVGCWFAYMAASEIYLVLTGRATTHTLPPASGTLPNTPAPGITALSIFVVVAGILMAVFPAKALAVFGHVWPAGRSVTPSAAPKVMLVLRLCGVFFAVLAFMSLFH
jgi:hypothetical protein